MAHCVEFPQLAPRDAEFVYNEHSGHPEHLMAVYLFDADAAPDLPWTDETARGWMRARLGSHRAFTSVITGSPLGIEHPCWVPAARVDLSNHVHVRAVNQPGWDGLSPVLGEILSSQVDLTRPPWELHVLTHVTGLDIHEGSLTVVALKLHHSVADGLAVMDLARKLFSETPVPARDQAAVRLPRLRILAGALAAIPARTKSLVRAIPGNRESARAVEDACAAGAWPRSLARTATRFNLVTSGCARVRSIRLPGEQIDLAKRAAAGITVNDVVLAAIGGATDRYLRERGEPCDSSLIAMVPRSVRAIEEWESANQLVALAVDLHTDLRDPIDRLEAVSQSAQSEKRRTSHPAVRRQIAAMDTAPPLFWRAVSYMHKRKRYEPDTVRAFHTMVSNIPLTVEGLVFGSAPAVGVLGSQPPVNGDRLRHFVTTGTGGDLTLTVVADPEAMPDLEHYLDLVQTILRELAQATGARAEQDPPDGLAS